MPASIAACTPPATDTQPLAATVDVVVVGLGAIDVEVAVEVVVVVDDVVEGVAVLEVVLGGALATISWGAVEPVSRLAKSAWSVPG